MTIPAAQMIMDATQLAHTLDRLAGEIAARNAGVEDLALIGVMNRGDLLARRLARSLSGTWKRTVPVGDLDITFHRDDAASRATRPGGTRPSHVPFSLEGKLVILVDDVLFTGRSIRAAMDELIDYGRPRAIQLAVLIDRGHRELPIHADFVGQRITTAPSETVAVLLAERDDRDAVEVRPGGPPVRGREDAA